ncbi:methyl-accepting chemotaxis protein [Svornostia abyssi]|uniref:Methyl-accepting chemotaxis protein n=1 Tax=Svornostia abyssi TaxID=2898438 RepID=A0ABY5PDE1_9ACTN|nr:methyl-accepting chemotaxis protein [Parviterribacteraceae bacterium J379]
MSWKIADLSVRAKLAAMLAVPLLGLIAFGLVAIDQKRTVANQAAAIEDLTGLAGATGAFLHESQRERGLTSLQLNGADVGEDLQSQRAKTDKALTTLREQTEGTADAQPAALRDRATRLVKETSELRDLREQVDAGAIPAREAVGWYTATHGLALDAVGEIAGASDDPALAGDLDAYVAYLGAKEAAGIERATLAAGLRNGAWPDAATLQGFVSAVAVQTARLHTFDLTATPQARAFAERTVAGDEVAQATKIREGALAGLTADTVTGAKPAAWFAAQTARIDRMKQVEDRLAKDLVTEAADIRAAATRDVRLYALLVLAAIAAGLGIAFVVARQLRRAVATVLDRLRTLSGEDVPSVARGITAMADGDLTVTAQASTAPIARPGRDEIGQIGSAVNDIADGTGQMAHAYNETRATLASMLEQVSATAQTVSSSSQEMAATSQEAGTATGEIAHAITDMAHGAERQVRMVESARQTAEEVVSATEMAAQGAQRTAGSADEARTAATEGGEAVARVTEAMRGVREASEEATRSIQGLGAKSDAIGGIIATIRAIAEQTNLLALNAAIEAARAGERGRGFAVVAEEVRKLAEESQDAARSIGELVTEIQHETNDAVTVVERGARRSEESGVIVEDARQAFERIGASVEDVSGQVADIVAAAERIAGAAQAMRESMEEVAAVSEEASASTQQVSASTEETSASAQQIAGSAASLASTAAELENLASRFRVA